MEDYSYLGSGKIYIRPYGAAAPFTEVGNCSALNFQPQLDKKTLPNYTEPGGGTQNTVERVTGVQMNYTFHDFSPENFARTLRGQVTQTPAGTVAAEAVVAYKGGLAPLAKLPTSITSVEPTGGGTPYTVVTDYEFREGGIYLPATSTIPEPIAGAPNIEVEYAHAAQSRVDALVTSAKQYEVLFIGLNEAKSGKPVRVVAHKVSGGVLQDMGLLGDDYGAGQVSGDILMDPSKVGAGVSKYFYADLVT